MATTWTEMQKLQPRVMKLLQNSIERNRLAHAYLFEGRKGTGKLDAATLLAKSFFCLEEGAEPCESCRNCQRIESGNHPDVHVVHPDGLSIKKGQIQALQEEFSKTGLESHKKLYIISHADQMTVNAANSLLKFLEEPSSDTIAVLLTEQPQKLLDTIISRCQVLSFQSLQPESIEKELIKQEVSPNIAALLSNMTNNLSEALELSRNDQFAESRAKVIKLYEVLHQRKGHAFFYIQDQWMPFFKEKDHQEMGLDMLLFIYRDVLSIQLGHEDKILFQDLFQSLKQHALQTTQQRVTNQILAVLEAKKRLYSNVNAQGLMEHLVLMLQEG
ncbi:DNA polymerase III subunit delta' [Bacillus haynesii]|uniref:DNA polymerase III subunit delta' n=1 Tax=Bacillus haynesii TaxID=1925021 RepID=UPI0015945C49|nr:DNA polymerase III subunit delta' [Bacillus haynesii]NVB35942.1 DNA polymerase III subunit delta' [Bacillus licheniformis]MEC1345094.1 DNA polymerase III subunit delta' [Bacillus haynesii]MEC1420572.1 DNA polymerase III subunit delta' [Bacillus haynesii]MEC1467565.1 DNA polymerase III subunit delta' [Bacillus haynesii]MEC1474899.1 DNA polymerase III subunit delta' [Bacillus haynesii]